MNGFGKKPIAACCADEKLDPLKEGLVPKAVVPQELGWTDVPGLTGVEWRRSAETFQQGTSGPLFYDVRIKFA